MKKLLAAAFGRLGYRVDRLGPHGLTVVEEKRVSDLVSDRDFMALYERCRPFTMTSLERMYALYQAVRYLVRGQVPGSLVECGVWRGGSCMLAALALLSLGDSGRELYLYDTYEGMSEPVDQDVDHAGAPARGVWADSQRDGHNAWCYASLDEVRQHVLSTGYPADRIRLVKGKVEASIPGTMPGSVALLRLDTDWYESTYHELRHLYPILSPGGVLIVDDYGHWQGCRDAVDQYFAEHSVSMLLNRIDYTGRIGNKTGVEA